MKDMGVGVVKGAWTTFLGAVALLFSQSAAFRTFFYMFSGIIVVALAHGMFFVPSVMGELTFLWKGIEKETQKQERKISKVTNESKDIRDQMTTPEAGRASNVSPRAADGDVQMGQQKFQFDSLDDDNNDTMKKITNAISNKSKNSFID